MTRRQRGHRLSDTRRPTSQPATPGTPAAVRAQARAQLWGYPEVSAIDALLVADILGTDAIRWGRTVHQVRVYSQFPRLGIEVTSAPAAAAPPPALPESPDDGISRLLLEELTLSWGVEGDDLLRTVWADLRVAH